MMVVMQGWGDRKQLGCRAACLFGGWSLRISKDIRPASASLLESSRRHCCSHFVSRAITTTMRWLSLQIGLKLETVTLEHLGRAKKVTVGKDDTLVMHGAGSKEAIAERVDMLREMIEKTTSDYEKEKLQVRTEGRQG